MATPDQLLGAARAQIGVTENPSGSNRNPYAQAAGHPNGQPWCATFVVAMARQVGLHLPSESAYTPAMANGFRQTGAWHPGVIGAASGDIVFYDFPDATTGIEHVGIIETASATGVTAIEGNTSSGNVGSQDNGGGVYRRSRPAMFVVGYGRPTWTAAPPPHTETVPIPVHDFEEATVKQMMVHVGPLDKDGNGWADWQPGLGRDPNIVGLVQLGPSPPDDGAAGDPYWMHQAKVNLSAQPRGGALRVVVRNGRPGDTVTAWATVA